jgi:hypothetical protein
MVAGSHGTAIPIEENNHETAPRRHPVLLRDGADAGFNPASRSVKMPDAKPRSVRSGSGGVSWTDFDVAEVLSIGDERGLFACRDVPENVVVGVFDGTVEVFAVDSSGRVDWRAHDGAMSIHLKLTADRLYTIMPTPGTTLDGIDFINHSCKPNCRADAGTLVVETTRFVAKGEQLTINYHRMDLIKLGRPCWCANVPDDERCIL